MADKRRLTIGILAALFLISAGIYIYFQRPTADEVGIENHLKSARLGFEQQDFSAAAIAYEQIATDIQKVNFNSDDEREIVADEAYSYWLISLLNQKDYDAAFNVGQKYLAIGKNPSADFFVVYGNLLRIRGDLDNAISQYQRALGRENGHGAASINLADVYIEQGKLVEAEELIHQAIGVALNNSPEREWEVTADPIFYWILSRIYDDEGQAEKAAEARQAAASLEQVDKPLIQITPIGSSE